ncbi:MAG TPA: cysteine dioxygenase family protein [Polyangiaceae bacterium]|nr:cysteine dioxygenase family protein [Polyangiaceae bacterium]
MARGANAAIERRRAPSKRGAWQELLELAQRGESAELRERAAQHFADSRPGRPEPGAGEPYGRQVLYQGAAGEVMLAGWARGGRSAPHDHGDASGFVLVLEGKIRESRYRFDGRQLRCAAQCEFGVHELSSAQAGDIHDLHAVSGGLTLHFYTPEIFAMRVYDVERRSTLLVGAGGGAWIPQGGAGVREVVAWAPVLAPCGARRG